MDEIRFAENLAEICEFHFSDPARAADFYTVTGGDSAAVRAYLIEAARQFTRVEAMLEMAGLFWDGDWTEAMTELVDRLNRISRRLDADELFSLCVPLARKYMADPNMIVKEKTHAV